MAWTDQVFRYCERGSDPAFWAEPVNAVTNLAFIIAAASASVHFFRAPNNERGGPETVLIALVFAIGIGSFLFHTFATRWAALADIGPITLFMLTYFGYALRRFLNLDWGPVCICLGGFLAALWIFPGITCAPGFMPISNGLGVPCLNGTVGYLPALAALAVIGMVLSAKKHAAGHTLLMAAAVFAVSMAFRTLDFEVCRSATVLTSAVGTHFVWHLLNAVVLYLLTRAALLHGRVHSHD